MSRAFRLGIFVVMTLLVLGAGIFWIGSSRFLFRSTWRLNADFPNVAGVINGGEVRVAGIHHGTVRRIEVPSNPTGKVHVEMELDGAARQVGKKGSMAS